jgi:hypothetical protein
MLKALPLLQLLWKLSGCYASIANILEGKLWKLEKKRQASEVSKASQACPD